MAPRLLLTLLKIANLVEEANTYKSSEEKKKAVFEVIERADYGRARNYQMPLANSNILNARMETTGQISVYWSLADYVSAAGVGSVKEDVQPSSFPLYQVFRPGLNS